MADYQAKISLIVEGQEKIKSLENRINNLSKQIGELSNLDIKGVFEDPLTSGAVSKIRKVRGEEVKATQSVIKGQRLINKNTEEALHNQIRLNSVVALYNRRLNELSRTNAADQKQFKDRIEDIQAAFNFAKNKGSVKTVSALATELGRIIEHSREVTRIELGRVRSQEQLRDFAKEINKYQKLSLDTSKAQAAFDKFSKDAGTNKYVLAEKYTGQIKRHLKILKDQATELERIEKIQNYPKSSIKGGADIIDSPLNKKRGEEAAAALQKQKDASIALNADIASRVRLRERENQELYKQLKFQEKLEKEFKYTGTAPALRAAGMTDEDVRNLNKFTVKEVEQQKEAAAALQKQKDASIALNADIASRVRLRERENQELYKQLKFQEKLEKEFKYTGTAPALRAAGMTDEDVRKANAKPSLYLNNFQQELAEASGKLNRARLNTTEYTEALQNYANVKAKVVKLEKDHATALNNAERAARGLQTQEKRNIELEGRRQKIQSLRLKKQKAEELGTRAESIALGVGFPMMFGAGPGTIAGSLAGSFVGTGFGGQILGGALGQMLDQFGEASIGIGKALLNPIENFEKLREAALFASREQEFYISKLIETGRVAEATAVIQAEMIKKIGTTGVNDLATLGNASIELSKAFGNLNLQFQALLAGPLTGFLRLITDITEGISATIESENIISKLRSQGQESIANELNAKVHGLKEKGAFFGFPGFFKGASNKQDTEAIKNLNKYYKSFIKDEPVKTPLTPEDREKAIKAAEQQADIIKDAYRTAFRLQQQSIDLQRQGSDLQRRVAQDMYNKQQEILRLQIDNDRQRKQVAIEMVDLEYRRRISNEEGRVAQVLEAEAAFMKTKAEGEANIEAKKRQLELDINKQKRETENYIFQLNRDIENFRRDTLNYEMMVADYRLSTERKIAEERRIQAAGANTPGETVKDVFDIGLVKGVFDTGLKTGPSQFIGGSADYHQDLSFGPTVDLKQKRALLFQLAEGYDKLGKKIELSNDLVAGRIFPLKGSIAEQNKFIQDAELAHRSRKRGTGRTAIDFYTPNKGENRHGESVVNTRMYAPVIPGGEKVYNSGGNAGASITVIKDGKTIYTLMHGATNIRLPKPGKMPELSTAEARAAAAGAQGAPGSRAMQIDRASQLRAAAAPVVSRPFIPMVNVSDAANTRRGLDKQEQKLKKDNLDIEKQLYKLKEQAALDRLLEIARGPKEIEQRKKALAYEEASLSNISASNKELQDRLEFEAKSNVQLELIKKNNVKILETTKLQGKDKEFLNAALEDGLSLTKNQIDLDRELLNITQQRRFKQELAGVNAELGVTGKGLQAGFIGQARATYEKEMLESGDPRKAQALALQTEALQIATTKAAALEDAYIGIGGAIASLMTDGVAGLVEGTTTAQQVFANFLKAIGDALMKAAQQMIAQYMAIATAKAIAGLLGVPFGGGGGNGGAGFAFSGIDLGGGGMALNNSRLFDSQLFSFADGGIPPVGRPSLVGERGPELFVPRTTGTIIPTDTTAVAMARYQRRSNNGNNIGSNSGAEGDMALTPVLSMSFETTRFLGQDYVSTEQLQAAMIATEKRAAAAGAKAGAAQITTKLQQSPSYRRQVGLK
jgi:hypothetical protein